MGDYFGVHCILLLILNLVLDSVLSGFIYLNIEAS